MKVEDLWFDAAKCILHGCNLTLTLPIGQQWPPGFPRGELLSVGTNGSANRSYDPLKVLAWVQRATLSAKAIHGSFEVTDSTTTGMELAARTKD